MTDWLERYRDSEVEIHYLTDNNAYKDRGKLVDFGQGWVELFKPNVGDRGETFAIPVSSIRIMKILTASRPLNDDSHLLRPVEYAEAAADVERRRLGDQRMGQEIRSE